MHPYKKHTIHIYYHTKKTVEETMRQRFLRLDKKTVINLDNILQVRKDIKHACIVIEYESKTHVIKSDNEKYRVLDSYFFGSEMPK